VALLLAAIAVTYLAAHALLGRPWWTFTRAGERGGLLAYPFASPSSRKRYRGVLALRREAHFERIRLDRLAARHEPAPPVSFAAHLAAGRLGAPPPRQVTWTCHGCGGSAVASRRPDVPLCGPCTAKFHVRLSSGPVQYGPNGGCLCQPCQYASQVNWMCQGCGRLRSSYGSPPEHRLCPPEHRLCPPCARTAQLAAPRQPPPPQQFICRGCAFLATTPAVPVRELCTSCEWRRHMDIVGAHVPMDCGTDGACHCGPCNPPARSFPVVSPETVQEAREMLLRGGCTIHEAREHVARIAAEAADNSRTMDELSQAMSAAVEEISRCVARPWPPPGLEHLL
jgi:hypothetical protein